MHSHWALFLLLAFPVAVWSAGPQSDSAQLYSHVGLAYRYVEELQSYVSCSGSLVKIPGVSDSAVVFLTRGHCIAFSSGNGAQFEVTFAQSPGFTRDPIGRLIEINTSKSYTGIGYTEFRTETLPLDSEINFGFIVILMAKEERPANIPSLPAQVSAFRAAYPLGVADFSSLSVIGYGLSDDADHVTGDRRVAAVKSAHAVRPRINVELEDGSFLADSGESLISREDNVLYGQSGLVSLGLTPVQGAEFLRTDSASFQQLLQRVTPLIEPYAQQQQEQEDE